MNKNKIFSIVLFVVMLPVVIIEVMKFDTGFILFSVVENPYIYFILYISLYLVMNFINIAAVYIFTVGLSIENNEKHYILESVPYIYSIIEIIIVSIITVLGLYETVTFVDVPIDEPIYSYSIDGFLAVFSYIVSIITCVVAQICQKSLKPQY